MAWQLEVTLIDPNGMREEGIKCERVVTRLKDCDITCAHQNIFKRKPTTWEVTKLMI